MSRIVAIVEARMTSTRLPGKNLRLILGRPMISRLVERLCRAQLVDGVCIATSTDPEDDVLEEVAEKQGVACFRGSLDDVLARTLGAATAAEADVIAEITGDCPLVDPDIVDAVLRRYLSGGHDYVANILDRLSFPIGFDVQVYPTALLREVAGLAEDPYDRGNVTPFIYRHPERYRLLNLLAPGPLDRPRYRLCVDYQEDLDVVTEVYEALYPEEPAFTAFDIVGFMDRRPDLVAHNTWREDAFAFPSSGGAARQEVLTVYEG